EVGDHRPCLIEAADHRECRRPVAAKEVVAALQVRSRILPRKNLLDRGGAVEETEVQVARELVDAARFLGMADGPLARVYEVVELRAHRRDEAERPIRDVERYVIA